MCRTQSGLAKYDRRTDIKTVVDDFSSDLGKDLERIKTAIEEFTFAYFSNFEDNTK